MRWWWQLILGIIGLVILAMVVGTVLLSLQDANKFKDIIARKVSEKTGRELTIAGNFDLSISFSPSLTADDVTFENAAWGSRSEILKLGHVEAKVALFPILGGNLEIERLILDDMDLLAETNEDSIGNWVFGDRKTADDGDDGDGELPVTVGLIAQLGAEAVEPARPRGANQGCVKGLVQRFPFRIGGVGPFLRRAGNPRQPMKGQYQVLLPVGAAMGNRLAERDLLQPAARPHQLFKFGTADVCDVEPLLVLAHHKPVRRQPVQCLADWAVADAVAVAHEFDAQLFARRQDAAQNVVS